ncbi:MAG: DUF4114 domain-containing protein [Polyangiales bacterium]
MRAAAVCLALATLLLAPAARALTQPDGKAIPTEPGCDGGKPTGLLSVFACACTTPGICNIGAPCASATSCDDGKKGTCESRMYHVFNDNTCIPTKFDGLDPYTEAATTPETFRPTCALTFTIVSRGTALFKDTFGWYNVTGSKPDPSDLHPMLGCSDGTGKSVVLDLSKEPAYKGGDVGFFLMTPESHTSAKSCAAGDCCPTVDRFKAGEGWVYYSERKYNPDPGGYIHLLTYNSHLSKTKFYFAWEDLFVGGDNGFTDLVTSVDGVQCSGGGVSCDTGKSGACKFGVTQCAAGAVSCSDAVAPKPTEDCNGVDDDCNGKVDDGAICPRKGDSCINGRCLPPCASGELKCDPGTVCDTGSGRCVDAACVGKTCGAGEVCRAGACVAPCSDVTCPYGQLCLGDKCVGLCEGVKCPTGQVCRSGLCFAGCTSCSGVACGTGTKCDPASGDCLDPSCATPCAAGTHCKSGACVDDCDGAKCPTGQVCTAGHCVSASAPGSDAGLGEDGGPLFGDAGGDATAGASPASDETSKSSCQCNTPGSARTNVSPLALLALLLLRRRR